MQNIQVSCHNYTSISGNAARVLSVAYEEMDNKK
jgi:hypothetical protein